MSQVKAYEIKITGIDRTIKNLADLREAQKAVNKEMDSVAIGSKRYEELKRASIELKATQALLRKEISGAASELSKSSTIAGAAEGSYVKLKAQMKALEDEYRRLGNSAEDSRRKMEIGAEVRKIRAQLKKLDEELGREGLSGAFQKVLTSTKTQVASLATLLTSGVILGAIRTISNGIRTLISDSLELADVQEQAQQTLFTALKGNVEQYERLTALASEFQSKTLVGDEEILQIEALAINMGVTEDQMQDFITAVLNVSQVTGADFTSSAKNVAKTFAGMKGELGELIPQLSTLSKEELKAGKAVDLLNQIFAGQAEAAAKVGKGPLKQIQNLLGDLGEQIGGLALDVFNFFSGGIKDGVSSAVNSFKKLRESTNVIISAISGALEALRFSFKKVVTDLAIVGNNIKKIYFEVSFALSKSPESAAAAAVAKLRIEELKKQKVAIEELGGVQDVYRKKFNETIEAFKKYTKEQEDARAKLKAFQEQQDAANAAAAKGKSRIEALQKQQKALNASILNSIAVGGDYEEQLKKLVNVSNELQNAQDDMALAIAKSQPESIASLKKQLSIIDSQIQRATTASELQSLLTQRAEVEAAVKELEQRIEKLKQDAALKSLVVGTKTSDVFTSGPAKQAGIQEELSQKRIASIEAERDLRIASAIHVFDTEKTLNDELARIKFETDKEILKEKLSQAKQGSEEEAALIRELAELELQEYKRVTEEKKKLDEDWQQAKYDIANTISSLIFETEKANVESDLQAKLEAINSEFDAKIAAAEGDAEAKKKLEKQKEQAIVAAQRKAGEQKRQIAITEAVINAALAATKTLAELGLPAALPFLATLAVTTAAQIAKISSQQFAAGGYTGDGLPYRDNTGFKVAGVVHEGEYVVPKKVLQTPIGAALTAKLEELRKKRIGNLPSHVNSYATGGFVTPIGSGVVVIEATAKIDEDDVSAMLNAVAAGARIGSEKGITVAGEKAVEGVALKQRLQENLER